MHSGQLASCLFRMKYLQYLNISDIQEWQPADVSNILSACKGRLNTLLANGSAALDDSCAATISSMGGSLTALDVSKSSITSAGLANISSGCHLLQALGFGDTAMAAVDAFALYQSRLYATVMAAVNARESNTSSSHSDVEGTEETDQTSKSVARRSLHHHGPGRRQRRRGIRMLFEGALESTGSEGVAYVAPLSTWEVVQFVVFRCSLSEGSKGLRRYRR